MADGGTARVGRNPAGHPPRCRRYRRDVRVVTIAIVDQEVVGFGHGSGFAVGSNRIVTNAHVVELAQQYPDNVVIGVVPSEGSKSYQARVIAIDTKRDLALLEIVGARI